MHSCVILNICVKRISKIVNMIYEVMRMRIDRVKICMGLGILLLMAGCSAGVSTEPESSLQDPVQIMGEGNNLAT